MDAVSFTKALRDAGLAFWKTVVADGAGLLEPLVSLDLAVAAD